MRRTLLTLLIGLSLCPWLAQAVEPLKVKRIEGQEYVAAESLPTAAQVAIKELPGRAELVACYGERCALLEKTVRHDQRWWIRPAELAELLQLDLTWNESRTEVSFTAPTQTELPPANPATQIFKVGDLAPDFRLPRLDGGSIQLSELRGKRVLINSWASW